MTNNTFYLDYNVTGEERKRLVKAISTFTGADAKYLGAPSFAYEVDYFTIDKNGCVSFDDRADSEEIEGLIDQLVQQGFVARVSDLGCADAGDEPQEAAAAEPEEPTQVSDPGWAGAGDEPQEAAAAVLEEPAEEPAQDAGEAATEPDSAEDGEQAGLTVSLPMDGFTADALDRLHKLVDSKAGLIRKALGADRLDIMTEEEKVSFPWWDRMPEPNEVQAYMSFIAAICAMAKEAKRVTATEKEIESEKYAFRCFLLRLGFIGSENKDHRKVLMRRLSGSSAFPNKEAAKAFSAAQKAKRGATKASASAEPSAEERDSEPAEEATV